jgi:hypothetical protein
MQAKALRSAVDSGLEVSPEVIDLAIKSVRGYYRSADGSAEEAIQRTKPGQFTYNGGGGTVAMAAAGVVCMQEFGQYDDWRIAKNMDVIEAAIKQLSAKPSSGEVPLDAYTLYYVGQALYQVGGRHWEECYPKLRDILVANQVRNPNEPRRDGQWRDTRHLGGTPADLYGTSVGCFILAMPNRYLPILQEGKIDSLRSQFQNK